jgi:hypothetical protein
MWSEGVAWSTAGSDYALIALHIDCKTVLGSRIPFASTETLEKALRYLGATDEQIEDHRSDIRRWGQGSTNIRLLPNRKNLLRVDWNKL